MTDTSTVPAALVAGNFRLVTTKEVIIGAYQDDREITVVCGTGPMHQKFRAVFRLSDLPRGGYRGQTTSPEGFSLLYYEEGGQSWVEILPR